MELILALYEQFTVSPGLPGAAMSSSFESGIFRKHIQSLQSVIEQDIDVIVDALVAGGVIDEVVLDAGSSSRDKATHLLDCVMKGIENDPCKLQTFFKVLKSLGLSNVRSLVEKIEVDCGKPRAYA